MARLRRDARLETRDARLRLTARRDPYWRQLERRLSLGYRRSKKKASGSWHVRRFDGDKYHFARLGSADDYDTANGTTILSYAEASRAAVACADEAVRAKAIGVNPNYTVGDCVDDYLAWHAIYRKATDRTRYVVDKHIRPSFGPMKVADLSTRALRSWHAKLADTTSQSSANRVLTVLKAALNRAWSDGLVANADAWRRVAAFRGADRTRTGFLTLDDTQRLLNSCEADFRSMVQGALVTGCRYGELCAMRVNDYHSDAATVTVREPKNNKPRHVPLSDEGVELFEQLCADRPGSAPIFVQSNGKPWAKDLQQRRMRCACAQAGIEPAVSFHMLRHTYGSALAMRGASLHVIAEVLGHADTRMTSRHYAHLLPSYVADTVRSTLPRFSDPAPFKGGVFGYPSPEYAQLTKKRTVGRLSQSAKRAVKLQSYLGSSDDVLDEGTAVAAVSVGHAIDLTAMQEQRKHAPAHKFLGRDGDGRSALVQRADAWLQDGTPPHALVSKLRKAYPDYAEYSDRRIREILQEEGILERRKQK